MTARVEWVCILNRPDAHATPVGTPVIVQRDNGTLLETTTRETPRELGGQPVLDCVGISGPYAMRRIFVRVAP